MSILTINKDYLHSFSEAMSIKIAKNGSGLYKLQQHNLLMNTLSDVSLSSDGGSSSTSQDRGHNNPYMQIENLRELNTFKNNTIKLLDVGLDNDLINKDLYTKEIERRFNEFRNNYEKERTKLKKDLKDFDKKSSRQIQELEKHIENLSNSKDKRKLRWVEHNKEKLEDLKISVKSRKGEIELDYKKARMEKLQDLKSDVSFVLDNSIGLDPFRMNDENQLNIIKKNIPMDKKQDIYKALNSVGKLNNDDINKIVDDTLNDKGLKSATHNYLVDELEKWREENPNEITLPIEAKEELLEASKHIFITLSNDKNIIKDLENNPKFQKLLDEVVNDSIKTFEGLDKNTIKWKQEQELIKAQALKIQELENKLKNQELKSEVKQVEVKQEVKKVEVKKVEKDKELKELLNKKVVRKTNNTRKQQREEKFKKFTSLEKLDVETQKLQRLLRLKAYLFKANQFAVNKSNETQKWEKLVNSYDNDYQKFFDDVDIKIIDDMPNKTYSKNGGYYIDKTKCDKEDFEKIDVENIERLEVKDITFYDNSNDMESKNHHRHR